LASPRRKDKFLAEKNEETSSIQIFTDGSKSKQGRGAGVAIFRSGKHKKSKTKEAPTINPSK
jgi:hypothetical protein